MRPVAIAPRASVIVPARNAQQTLSRTLAALAAQQFDGEFEVIVVDDGSSDDTAALARRAHGVTVLRQPPLGPAAARNHGVSSSAGTALAFCDADVFPAPGWLAAGIEALSHADIVQGKVLPDPDARLGPFDRTIWITFEVGLFETANLFVTRELFERVGGFEEWLKPRVGKALAEDVWFGYRANRLGARSAYSEHALAHHAVFERGWRQYVAERRRLQYFPAMARKMPELRSTFLYRRTFLSTRSAQLDLALSGSAAALALSSPIPAVGALPYLRTVRRHAGRAHGLGPGWTPVAAADMLADIVGLVAMIAGSWRYRSVVL
jgi:glycosyltransferase involved in cell wall biosynthesis